MDQLGKHPISIFILDVRGSSSMQNPEELTDYLGLVVQRIQAWTNGVIEVKAKHRLGDEIIFLGEHFFSAYAIANFIKKFWKYEQHPPYFGLTYGYLDKRVSSIPDLDTWNHGLVKYARTASESLKKEPTENWLRIEKKEPNIENRLLYELLQSNVSANQVLLARQTKPQQTACSLFSVLHKQLEVAQALKKSASTISNQIKQGICDLVLKMEQAAETALLSLECKEHPQTEIQKDTMLMELIDKRNELHHSIGSQIKNNLLPYLETR